MKRKQIRQQFEGFLKKHGIAFRVDDDRAKSLTRIQMLFPCLPPGITFPELMIYRRYLVLDLLGWKVYEKNAGEDDEKGLQISGVFNAFLEKNLKIKTFYRKEKLKGLQVYRFIHGRWNFYGKALMPWFFRKRQRHYRVLEWNIEDLMNQSRGKLPC
jgi:hypothetical protein